MKSFKETMLDEGKLDDFDKAYNTWIKATKKMTVAFEAAATNKAGVTSFKLALAKVEKAIDKGDMRS
jgi:acetyl-CoA carboxylase beta subunit